MKRRVSFILKIVLPLLLVLLFLLVRHIADLLGQYSTYSYVLASLTRSSDSSSSAPHRQSPSVDKVIVIAKLERESTQWVEDLLYDWQHAIYTVDPSAGTPENALVTPLNKGREAMAYLTYIIDNYDSLPSVIAFLHAHRSGFLTAWHTDTPLHDNVWAMEHLQLDFVQRNGYVNLRCKWNPGCIKLHRRNQHITNEVWQAVFNNTSTPPPRESATSGLAPEAEDKAFSKPAEVAAACCAQFAVSREQVLKRPREDYVSFRRWVTDTELSDAKSGRVMEYLWHIIFGMEAV